MAKFGQRPHQRPDIDFRAHRPIRGHHARTVFKAQSRRRRDHMTRQRVAGIWGIAVRLFATLLSGLAKVGFLRVEVSHVQQQAFMA